MKANPLRLAKAGSIPVAATEGEGAAMPRDPRIGTRIREARLEAGLSLSQLCGSRLSPPHLSFIEHGKRGVSADRLVYMAARLGRSVGSFLPQGIHSGYVEALICEAEKLARSGEHSRAAALFGDLLPHVSQDRADLGARCRVGLGTALFRLRQYDLAVPHLEEGKRLAENSRDLHLIAQARNAAGAYYLEQNEYHLALAELQAALVQLRQHSRPDPNHLSMVLGNIGQAFMWLRQHREALAHLREAAQIAQVLGDDVRVGIIARSMARVLIDMCAYDEARGQLEFARDHFTKAERLDMVASAENGLGILLLQTGNVEQAIPHLQRAGNLWARLADDRFLGRNLTELGRAHILLGRHDEALPYVQEAIRLAMKVNDDVEAASAEALRGEILFAQGRLDEAAAALRFAIPIFERREQQKELIAAHGALGRVLEAQGHSAEASEILSKALALAGVNVSIR